MIYIAYKCKACDKETILLTEEVENTLIKGKYIACPHCGCKSLIKGTNTDDLRECMKAREYKRHKGGALRQVR